MISNRSRDLKRYREKFEKSTKTQYTKELLFSTVVEMMNTVACGIRPSIHAAIEWATNMTWNGISPLVQLFERNYQRGVVVSYQELETFKSFWLRSENLPKWDVTVVPS
jgi:hypothetical protein